MHGHPNQPTHRDHGVALRLRQTNGQLTAASLARAADIAPGSPLGNMIRHYQLACRSASVSSSTNRCLGVAVEWLPSGTGAYESWARSNFHTNAAQAIYNGNQVWYGTGMQPVAKAAAASSPMATSRWSHSTRTPRMFRRGRCCSRRSMDRLMQRLRVMATAVSAFRRSAALPVSIIVVVRRRT